MKRKRSKKHQKRLTATTEMASLNRELFRLDEGNLSVEALDQRLELAIAVIMSDFTCGTFNCSGFDTCGEFGCGTFKIIVNKDV